jgi:hypothetical protein
MFKEFSVICRRKRKAEMRCVFSRHQNYASSLSSRSKDLPNIMKLDIFIFGTIVGLQKREQGPSSQLRYN